MQIYRMFFGISCCHGATRCYPTDDDESAYHLCRVALMKRKEVVLQGRKT